MSIYAGSHTESLLEEGISADSRKKRGRSPEIQNLENRPSALAGPLKIRARFRRGSGKQKNGRGLTTQTTADKVWRP